MAVRGFATRAVLALLLSLVVVAAGGASVAAAESGPAPVCAPDHAAGGLSERCVDLGATVDSEPVGEVEQPEFTPAPAFDTITGSFGGPFSLPPLEWNQKWRMSPALALGGGHLYVATGNGSAPYGPGVYQYSIGDGCPGAPTAPAGVLCKVAQGGATWHPNGITYYRGKVYVSRIERNAGGVPLNQVRTGLDGVVQVLSSDLSQTERTVRTLALTGLDAAWGELWGRVSDVGTVGGVALDYLAIIDPQTGALRGAAPVGLSPNPRVGNRPDAEPGSGAPTYTYSRGYVTAKDVAISPELNVISTGGFSMHRASPWALLSADPGAWLSDDSSQPGATSSLLNAITGDPGCYEAGPFDANIDSPVGAAAPWGMKWLIQIENSCTHDPDIPPKSTVREYKLRLVAGEPVGLVERVAGRVPWRPMDQTTDTTRDIAYQAHEPRITWSGRPTESPWQRGNHTLTYFVSDGEFYVVAKQVERWFDPANGFQNVVLTATRSDCSDEPDCPTYTLSSSDKWYGTLTINEDALPSGTYQLTMTATIGGGKTVTKTNPDFRVDHTQPAGSLDGGLPAATNTTVNAIGTLADAHSGPAKWNLQVNGPGTGGTFQTVCTATAPDPSTGKWGCAWNTNASQEGTFQVRALLEDQVQPAYGGANTLAVGSTTIIVDRTPPLLGNFAPSLDQATYEAVDRNPEPVKWTQSDSGAGISGTTVEVNNATDGSGSGSWHAIGSSSTAGEAEFNWNSSTVASGLHRFRATSTDRAGNQSRPEWQAILSNARPNAPDACPSCTRWYAGVNAGSGQLFYSWGVKGQLKTPSEAPAVEEPVRYIGEDRSTYQASSTWVGVGYQGRRAGWYQGGLITTENCTSNPQPGSPGGWYRYFEWKQGGTKTNRIYRFQCYARDQVSPPGALNTFKITLDTGHRAKGYLNSRLEDFDADPRPRGYWIDKYGHRQTIATGETTRNGRLMLGHMSLLGWRQTSTTSTWTPFNAGNYVFDDASNDTYTIDSNANDDRFCVAGPAPKTCIP